MTTKHLRFTLAAAALALRTLTTSTLQHDIYGFAFGQEGLMAGIGLQGSKITQIHE